MIQVSSGKRPAGFARLSAYTSARAEGTRICGSSALNVKLFSSFTKWNKWTCERENFFVQFTPKV